MPCDIRHYRRLFVQAWVVGTPGACGYILSALVVRPTYFHVEEVLGSSEKGFVMTNSYISIYRVCRWG